MQKKKKSKWIFMESFHCLSYEEHIILEVSSLILYGYHIGGLGTFVNFESVGTYTIKVELHRIFDIIGTYILKL